MAPAVYSTAADSELLEATEELRITPDEPVFQLIQRVRQELLVIDTPLSFAQLQQPTANFGIVRPLAVKLSKGDRPPPALIFALLVCRIHYLDVASRDLAFSATNTSRADLAELLAIKLLSAYGNAPQSLELLHVVTTEFSPFCGAKSEFFADGEVDGTEMKRLLVWGDEEASNALELAIFSRAKRFVKSPLIQQIVKAIHTGDVLYQPDSAHKILNDDYKDKPIVQLYDWRQRPFLDHQMLRVPRIRNRLEFFTFATILALFLMASFKHDVNRITIWEGLFIAFSIGFSIDELASIQDGLGTYLAGLYNTLDALFCVVFYAYLGMRVTALIQNDGEQSELAFATLSLAACTLFPRLTISLLRGNVVLMALSAMTKEFIVFMGLASLTASGFLVTLLILANGSWNAGRVSWLLLRIWLGNSFLGFEAAQSFHSLYGPLLMVAFAILSQTLLLTILISLLSNTFAAIQSQAETEILHQTALRTIERVKSDELSNYLPPFNLLAIIILIPTRVFGTSRWVHKTHVALTKTLNMPILLMLALYTRSTHLSRKGRRGYSLYLFDKTREAWDALPRGIPFDGSVGAIARVFEREVNEAALNVPSIDGNGEEDNKSVDEAGTATNAPGETQASAPPRSRSLPAVATGPVSTPNKRMGSLTSPLAKIFGSGRDDSTSKSDVPSTSKAAKLGSKDEQIDATADPEHVGRLEARLAAIESALAILVGEVVKAKDRDLDETRPPLVSLTGAVEESYAD